MYFSVGWICPCHELWRTSAQFIAMPFLYISSCEWWNDLWVSVQLMSCCCEHGLQGIVKWGILVCNMSIFEYICEWYQMASISDVIIGYSTWNQTDGHYVDWWVNAIICVSWKLEDTFFIFIKSPDSEIKKKMALVVSLRTLVMSLE